MERSVDFKERSIDFRDRSVDFWELSVDFRESVNAVEKNLQQKDFAYEFDGLAVGDEDNLASTIISW